MTPIRLDQVDAVMYSTYTIPVSKELLRDAGIFRSFINGTPWLRPDHNPMPRFVFFPLVEQLVKAHRRAKVGVQEARWRMDGAWSLLRHGRPLDEW